MRHALPLALAALLLGGCASHKPEDFNGTWINQDAIDAAVKGDSLRKALSSHGPVFEWKIDVASQQARYSNGFEAAEGSLVAADKQWQANFEGGQSERLSLDGDELQTTDTSGAKQTFVRSKPRHRPTPHWAAASRRRFTRHTWAVNGKSSKARARAPRSASPTTAA